MYIYVLSLVLRTGGGSKRTIDPDLSAEHPLAAGDGEVDPNSEIVRSNPLVDALRAPSGRWIEATARLRLEPIPAIDSEP